MDFHNPLFSHVAGPAVELLARGCKRRKALRVFSQPRPQSIEAGDTPPAVDGNAHHAK